MSCLASAQVPRLRKLRHSDFPATSSPDKLSTLRTRRNAHLLNTILPFLFDTCLHTSSLPSLPAINNCQSIHLP